ncbi:hypothetical protein K438DRAFT_268030 [Mycena galopus ATCC 62051]|nr:hypothetical protein K438DRAFT_268030 [Mycena galopus ATCC 62051]
MLGYPGQWHSHNLPSSTESITLPSIGILRDCVDSNLGQLLTIPFTTSPFTKHLPPNGISMKSWNGYPLCGEVMPTGWTRVEYLNNEESSFWMTVHLDPYYETAVMKWWISQQSYVRKHLQRAIGLEEDYLPLYLITHISIICDLETRLDGFTLQGTFMADAHSNKVYLFLAPPQVEILNGHFTVAVPPETERYYWAFDPDGVDRLTHAVAEDIGLPKPRFSFDCGGMNWDERTDEQIREFHAAKGFDPDSRDATIALGYPLVDIEAMKRSAQELTGQRFMTVPDPNQVENEIYYSLGLC